MRLAKIFIVIFAPDERLPSSATLSGFQLSSDPQSELCPKNCFFEEIPDFSLGAYLMATRKVLGNYIVGDHLGTNDEKYRFDTSALWCL